MTTGGAGAVRDGVRPPLLRRGPARPRSGPAGPALRDYWGSGPVATGREGSEDHWDQEPG